MDYVGYRQDISQNTKNSGKKTDSECASAHKCNGKSSGVLSDRYIEKKLCGETAAVVTIMTTAIVVDKTATFQAGSGQRQQ
jgi:hypothetical protein